MLRVNAQEKGAGGMAQAVSGTDGTRPGTLLADRAYVAIRDRVLTLQLPPGSPIDEDELIRELGIGRTPIREAIKRLALEDLVTVYPRRGTFVSDINISDLAQISDLRIQLEGHAAFRAAERATAADANTIRFFSRTRLS